MSLYLTGTLRKEAERYYFLGGPLSLAICITAGSLIGGAYGLTGRYALVPTYLLGLFIGAFIGCFWLLFTKSDDDEGLDDRRADLERLVCYYTEPMLRQMNFERTVIIICTLVWPAGLFVFVIWTGCKIYKRRTGWRTN